MTLCRGDFGPLARVYVSLFSVGAFHNMAHYWSTSRCHFVIRNYLAICNSRLIVSICVNLDVVKAVTGSNKFMQVEILKVHVKNNFIASNMPLTGTFKKNYTWNFNSTSHAHKNVKSASNCLHHYPPGGLSGVPLKMLVKFIKHMNSVPNYASQLSELAPWSDRL